MTIKRTPILTAQALGLMVLMLTFGLSARAMLADDGDSKKGEDPASLLSQDVGTWTAKCKFWVAGPDSDPLLSDGTEVNHKLGESGWILSDFEADFGGQKFKGHSITGYNSETKKISGTWVDTMSPRMITFEGSFDPATKSFIYEFDEVSPEGDKLRAKHVIQYKDGGRVMTAYSAPQSDPKKMAKMMEITYTRKK